MDDDWGRRYGRPVRLGKHPARPKTRMNEAGADARRLLEHLAARCPDLLRGPRVEALRQILVQNYHRDPAGPAALARRCGHAGLPPSAARIVSPYDPAARYSRRGQVTRWTGYPAHVTETCAETAPTSSPTSPPRPPPRRQASPRRDPLTAGAPGLLPGEHLADGGYTSPGPHGADRARAPGHLHRAAARQPHPPTPRPGGLRRDDFRTDSDRQE